MPHEYVRAVTAKLLTLFRPASGELRAKGVNSSANAILHPFLTLWQHLLDPNHAPSEQDRFRAWVAGSSAH